MNEPNKNRPSRTDWARVDAMTDEEIDTSDIPPLTDEFFKNATLRMPRKPATTTNRHDEKSDELRPEYDFDFSKSRPNRFANRVKEERVRVNLESDHKKKHAKAPIKRSESGAKRNNLAVNVEQKPVVDDPWLALLDHLNEHAVDTGIEDLSLNHDHYLYGVPKR